MSPAMGTVRSNRPENLVAHKRLAAPAVSRRTAPRGRLMVRAELYNKGRSHRAENIMVDKLMGEGSFGQVFNGSITLDEGKDERVVLKRVKSRVPGADAMGEMEHVLNVYAARAAKGYCADFLGYCDVTEDESTSRLTPGLWLIWRYEGNKTLGYYHKRRDSLVALGRDLGVPKEAAVAVSMKHILEGLAAFHAAGLVHRDVKPFNIILAEDSRRLKLIDLGACADLRGGTNYVPNETILDPLYCPPEQYILPTDTAKLAKNPLRLAISPMLWAQHRPDRFDTWSAGVVMLQTALPTMRTDAAVKRFIQDYGGKHDYDLDSWRSSLYLSRQDTAPLDEDDGAGWDLLQNLLRPRDMVMNDSGGVAFNNGSAMPHRLSAKEALKHRFMQQAVVPEGKEEVEEPYKRSIGSAFSGWGAAPSSRRQASSSRSSSGATAAAGTTQAPAPAAATGGFGGLWRSMTNKLFDLEAKIKTQASATEVQTISVKKLQQEAKAGRVDPAKLQAEEERLQKMSGRLGGLQQEFNATASTATNLFSALNFWGAKKPAAVPIKATAEPTKIEARGSSASKAGPIAAAASTSSTTSGSVKATPPSPSVDIAGGLNELWRQVSYKMGVLDAKLENQVSATRKQQSFVQEIKGKAAVSSEEAERLEREERRLSIMQQRLVALDQDFRDAQKQATTLLGTLFNGAPVGKAAQLEPNVIAFTTPYTPSASAAPVRTAAVPTPEVATHQTTAQAAQASTSGGAAAAVAGVPAAAAAPAKNGGGGWGAWWGAKFSLTPTEAAPATPVIGSSTAAAAAPVIGGTNQQGGAASSPATAASDTQSSATTASVGSSQQGAALGGPAVVASASTSAAAASPTGAGSSAAGGGAAPSSLGSKLTEGASSLVSNSLKFSGLAARLAANMAASFSEDAGKRIKKFEADQKVKRAQKAQEADLLALLAEYEVPVAKADDYEAHSARFAADRRWAGVPDGGRRKALWDEYMVGQRKKEKQTQLLAEANLRSLLRSSMKSADAGWSQVSLALAAEPAFITLMHDPLAQRRLFDEVAAELRLAASLREAAARSEQEFAELLTEAVAPAVMSSGTSWGAVKPLVWKDPRYDSVPEKRRREIFDAAAQTAKAAAQRAQADAAERSKQQPAPLPPQPPAATAPPPPAVPPAAATSPAAAGAGSPASPQGLMEQLRQNQARLKAEYDRMEAMLRSMETGRVEPPPPVAPPQKTSSLSNNGSSNAIATAAVGALVAGGSTADSGDTSGDEVNVFTWTE